MGVWVPHRQSTRFGSRPYPAITPPPGWAMDARAYFTLTDAIAAADTPATLDTLRWQVHAMDMHPLERHALERVLRSRADAIRLSDAEATRPSPQRRD